MEDMLRRAEIEELARARTEPAVSIYLPTHRGGAEIRQDPIRLKNLLAAASERVGEEHEPVLEPGRRLLTDTEFWRHQGDSLALFLAPDRSRWYRLPEPVAERVAVGDRFHLSPLLPLVGEGGRFYVLALSQGRVRVLEASRRSYREMDLEDVPASLEDAVGYDYEQRSLQFRSEAPAGGGTVRRAAFHGQGRPKDTSQELQRFVEKVDGGLRKMLPEPDAPVVVVAVDDVFGEFRKVSQLKGLLQQHVAGNPDETADDTLHERALELMAPRLDQGRSDAAAKFAERIGTGRATADVREAVRAAWDGRVESLLVAEDARRWGRFDPETHSVELGDEGDDDLVDLAAVQTFLRDGTVYRVPAEEMPDSSQELAAVFRY